MKIDNETNILFITGILSPFWIEFQNAINQLTKINFFILFTENNVRKRGSHWKNVEFDEKNVFFLHDCEFEKFTKEILKDIKPKYVIYGGLSRFFTYKLLFIFKKIKFDNLIHMDEQPLKSTWFFSLVKFAEHFFRYQYITHKATLAIGERGKKFFEKAALNKFPVFNFRYYQKLSFIDRKNTKEKLVFIFSGQLIERNNISLICKIIVKLYEIRPNKFKFIFAANGPQLEIIENMLIQNPKISECVSFNNNFINWEDRLKPFERSDVLLLPAKHSGWGLVVPEALSHGLFVISNKKVEAADFYIKDGINGILVNENLDDIIKACLYCIDNPKLIDQKNTAINTAHLGDLRAGCRHLVSIITRLEQK